MKKVWMLLLLVSFGAQAQEVSFLSSLNGEYKVSGAACSFAPDRIDGNVFIEGTSSGIVVRIPIDVGSYKTEINYRFKKGSKSITTKSKKGDPIPVTVYKNVQWQTDESAKASFYRVKYWSILSWFKPTIARHDLKVSGKTLKLSTHEGLDCTLTKM